MTRSFTFILACLLTGSAFGQSVLVNTRLHPFEFIDAEEQLQLDLREYFQLYPDTGPVATLTIFMPVPNMEMKLVQEDGNLVLKEVTNNDDADPRFMTYKLESGESYTDPYAHIATDYVWESYDVEFKLLAADAPTTVANFITYANAGAYDNTIVHRNESTGQVFRPGGVAAFNALPIIQAGGWTLYGDPLAPVDLDAALTYNDLVDALFHRITQLPAIPLERTKNNVKGTIAMARTFNVNSATCQFFINLEDNTSAFGDAYSVFGELVEPDIDQPIIDQFANSAVYDLATARPSGNPNVFPSLPFTTIPMYTPFWDYRSSYSRFSSITVSEGNPDGVSYSWEFADTDDEVSEEEAANRAAFDIQIEGSNLVITAVDTGRASIDITGTSGSESRTFTLAMAIYNEEALRKFTSATILQGGLIESPWYGKLNGLEYPVIIHEEHGEQYVSEYSDSDQTGTEIIAYDYNLESWIYTTSSDYPYIYAFNKELWLWYAEGTGIGDGASRWFYVFDGDNSGWYLENTIAAD